MNEKLDASQILFESVCRPEDIIDAIKTGNIKNTGLLQEDENRYSGNTKMLKAKEIINLDAIGNPMTAVPHAGGLQSCVLAEKPCFSVVRGDMVQILNTHPQSGGMHWLTISTVRCPKDTVNVYDSAGGFIISLLR